MRQKLPRKRDSLVDEGTLLAPDQPIGIRLTVPQVDLSRSASPVLEPMSARISDDKASALQLRSMESDLDDVADQPSGRMSARVAS